MGGYVVYKHTNAVNGKAYIGYTSMSLDKRWREHCYDARVGDDRLFTRAIAQHGEGSFNHEVLETTVTKDEALQAEVRLIAEHMTFAPHGYNMTLGGEGGSLTPDARMRYLEAVRSDAMRAKRSVNTRRAFQDPETRRRHSVAINAPEAKAKQSASLRATNSRPDVKERRSRAQRTAQNRPDVRTKKSLAIVEASKRHDVKLRRSAASFEVQNRVDVRRRKIERLSKAIEQISLQTGERVAHYASVKEASEATGIHYSNITGCASGNRRMAGGFVWRYEA